MILFIYPTKYMNFIDQNESSKIYLLQLKNVKYTKNNELSYAILNKI